MPPRSRRRRAPRPIAGSRVVHESIWVCWPLLGGCGQRLGLQFAGGACPTCGVHAVSRFVAIEPEEAR